MVIETELIFETEISLLTEALLRRKGDKC